MKKFFALLAIAGFMAACNNDGTSDATEDTTNTMSTDTMSTPMQADTMMVDTSKTDTGAMRK
jgi:hypothetical protein